MSVVYIILPIALLLGFGFLAAFIKTCAAGQYDDLETPAHRMLISDEQNEINKTKQRDSR